MAKARRQSSRVTVPWPLMAQAGKCEHFQLPPLHIQGHPYSLRVALLAPSNTNIPVILHAGPSAHASAVVPVLTPMLLLGAPRHPFHPIPLPTGGAPTQSHVSREEQS